MFKILRRTGPISLGDVLAYQIKMPLSSTWQTMATWKTSANDVETGNGPTWEAQPYPSNESWFIKYFPEACLQSGLSFPFVLYPYANIFGANNITYSGKTGFPFYLGRANVLEKPLPNVSTVFQLDSSLSALPFTTFSVLTDLSRQRFGTSSAKFDGTHKIEVSGEIYSDGISKTSPAEWTNLSNATAFNFDEQNLFTIECWVYIDDVQPGDVGVIVHRIRSTGTYHGINLILSDGIPRLIVGTKDKGWGLDINAGEVLSTKEWHHLAVSRQNDGIYLFADGEVVASAPIYGNIKIDQGAHLTIGGGPQGPLISDFSGNICTPSTGFSTTLSSTITKFGTKSARFSYVAGKNDVSFRKTGQFNLSTADFTIDFWIYPETSGNANIVGINNPTATPSITLLSDNKVNVKLLAGLSNVELTSLYPINEQEWTHVAFSRKKGNLYLIINGAVNETVSIPENAAIASISDVFFLGHNSSITTPWSNAFYLDNFRLSKGISRYESNFQLSTITGPSTADEYTSLLINFEDVSISNFVGNIDEVRVSMGISRYNATFVAPQSEFAPDSNTVLLYHFNKSFDSEKSQVETIIDAFAGTVVESVDDIPHFRIFNLTTSLEVGILENLGGSGLGIPLASPDRKEATAKLASTENINATYNDGQKSLVVEGIGIFVIDGVVPVVGDIILVKNQTNVYENGVYIVESNSSTSKFILSKQNKVTYPNWVEVTNGKTEAGSKYYQSSAIAKTLPFAPSIFKKIDDTIEIAEISDGATSRWRSQGLGLGVGGAGPTGPTGPANGPTGPTGSIGTIGPTGPMGTSLRLKGYVNTVENLPSAGNETGDCWIVQFASYDNYPYDRPEYEGSGHMWCWSGTEWVDAGRIVGPAGPQGPSGPTGPTGPLGGPPGEQGESGIVYRNTWQYVTPSIPVGDQFEFEIELGVAIIVYDLTLSRPCIIEVFGSPQKNEPNPYTFRAVPNHLTDDGTTKLGDGTIIKTRQYSIFANLEEPTPLPKVYARITNDTADSSPVTITLTYFTALVEAQGRPPKDLEIVTSIPATGTEGKFIYHREHDTVYLRLDGEWRGIYGYRASQYVTTPLAYGYGSSIIDVNYSGTTNGATPVELSIRPVVAPTVARLIFSDDSSSTITIYVSAICPTTGECMSNIINATLKMFNSVFDFASAENSLRKDSQAWDVDLVLNADRSLSIFVQGDPGKVINWVASVRGNSTGQVENAR